MINKLKQRLIFYRSIRFWRYLYWNYFCKAIVRTDNSRIIPYKNTVLDLAPGSRIYLGGGDLELGCDALRSSREETRVRLRENGIWTNEGGCRISYGTTVEVLSGALLDTRFFTVNSGSTIVAAKRISLGHDVMLGRGVVIYDSDHHTILDPQGRMTNPDAPVRIGDHVWLATNVTVLKGTTIGSGSMIGTNTVLRGEIPSNTLCQCDYSRKQRQNYGNWCRNHPN